jgi:hypothetical protein
MEVPMRRSLKRLAAVLVLSLAVAIPTSAEMQCFIGMPWTDGQGVRHCSIDSAGSCVICFDWIVVKG